jgi:hypothetical protein
MVEYHDRERAYRLVRVALAQSLQEEAAANAEDLDKALTSLDGIDAAGNTDHSQLSDEVKNRFAVSIDKDADGGYEAYVNKATAAAIDQGYAELVSTRTFRKIVTATASLGTAPDMAFGFTLEGEDEPVAVEGEERPQTTGEAVGELMNDYRETGRFRQALIRADRLSVALGSSALYVRWREGGPVYQAVPPQSVVASFADKVESNGELRATDTTDIDDATAVAIRLPDYKADSTAAPRVRYLVYCGRSEEYPRGRCLVYTVGHSGRWLPLPAVGSEDVLEEYTVGEEIANPLTLAQDEYGPDAVPTEYPISIFLGQDASADLGMLPTSGLALWRDTMEFDIGYSRVFSSAIEGARGLFVVTDTTGAPLPRSLTGAVAGRDGMKIEKVGHVAAHAAKNAVGVLESVQALVSNAYSVPAYQMFYTATTAPSSGYALDVQNLPKEERRLERIALNRGAVERVFAIERGLHYAHSDQPNAIPVGVQQHWNPGTIHKPVDKKAQIENLNAALTAKYIDYVSAVQQYHGFATEAEAIDYVEKMNERPPELAGPKKAEGGLRGLAAPPPRPQKKPIGGENEQAQGEDDLGAVPPPK